MSVILEMVMVMVMVLVVVVLMVVYCGGFVSHGGFGVRVYAVS